MSNIPDLSLLKLFICRDTYNRYIEFVNKDILQYEIKSLLYDFGKYFKEHEKDIVIPEFKTWFNHYSHIDLREDQRVVFNKILDRLEEIEPGAASSVLVKFQEYATKKEIENQLNNGFDIEQIKKFIEKHEELTKSSFEEEEHVPNDLSRILAKSERSEGLNWKLNCLNKAIGPLSSGMFIIVSAYVDIGKTAFCISETTYMAKQLTEGNILWLNNEEDDDRVLRKMWQSVLGINENELQKLGLAAEDKYRRYMNGDIDRIKLINIRNKSFYKIKKLFDKHKPKLVIIDQIDKISFSNNAFSEHDRLKDLYGKFRALANEYCPVIAVSQAAVTTTYKDKDTGSIQYQLYPHHSQLDGSKVGKPGEGDAIIMIGRKAEYQNSRGIHVSKNKFGDTIKQEVIFNGDICRYENP